MSLVLDVVGETLRSLLHEDSRRFVFGEDVAIGGHVGLTRPIVLDAAVAPRLIATPLVPSTLFAHVGGVALAGGLPIVVLPSASSLLDGLSGLRELARLRALTKGQQGVPALILAPSGAGFGLGGDAAWSAQSVVCQLPGLRVHELGCPGFAAHTVRSAANFESGEDPTLLLLPREVLLAPADAAASLGAVAQPGLDAIPTTRTHREGDAITIFTWGSGVERTLRAVDAAAYAVHVVELSTLAPLDVEAVVAAAQRTGRIVLVHGDSGAGVAAQVAALIADRCILSLDAPVVSVGPRPGGARGDEGDIGPTVALIYATIVDQAEY